MDTSAVIKYLNKTFPANGITFMNGFLREDCTISFITEIELQAWSPANPDDVTVYQEFISQSNIIGINKVIIAATALAFNRILVADNDRHFTRVPALPYINPQKL